MVPHLPFSHPHVYGFRLFSAHFPPIFRLAFHSFCASPVLQGFKVGNKWKDAWAKQIATSHRGSRRRCWRRWCTSCWRPWGTPWHRAPSGTPWPQPGCCGRTRGCWSWRQPPPPGYRFQTAGGAWQGFNFKNSIDQATKFSWNGRFSRKNFSKMYYNITIWCYRILNWFSHSKIHTNFQKCTFSLIICNTSLNIWNLEMHSAFSPNWIMHTHWVSTTIKVKLYDLFLII